MNIVATVRAEENGLSIGPKQEAAPEHIVQIAHTAARPVLGGQKKNLQSGHGAVLLPPAGLLNAGAGRPSTDQGAGLQAGQHGDVRVIAQYGQQAGLVGMVAVVMRQQDVVEAPQLVGGQGQTATAANRSAVAEHGIGEHQPAADADQESSVAQPDNTVLRMIQKGVITADRHRPIIRFLLGCLFVATHLPP